MSSVEYMIITIGMRSFDYFKMDHIKCIPMDFWREKREREWDISSEFSEIVTKSERNI